MKPFSDSPNFTHSRHIPRDFEVREYFTSVSSKGCIRGVHFQIPPFATDKLITVISGSVFDICLDLSSSSSFGRFKSFDLLKGDSLYIPAGIAHGFQALTDNVIMSYLCSQPTHLIMIQGFYGIPLAANGLSHLLRFQTEIYLFYR